MDTGGPEHDVHPSDRAQSAGKSLSPSPADHHLFSLVVALVLRCCCQFGHNVKAAGCVRGEVCV